MNKTIKLEKKPDQGGGKPSRKRVPPPRRIVVCPTATDHLKFIDFIRAQSPAAIWISCNRATTNSLLKFGIESRTHFKDSRLLTLTPPRSESRAPLSELFLKVFGADEEFRLLPTEELLNVVERDDAGERFIGGSVDHIAKIVALLRGDFSTLLAKFSDFGPSGDGTKPDFRQLAFTDYGNTVVLGKYEAAADAILYELDETYRRALRRKRKASDRSFGASLRRLRAQRKKKRTDFLPVSSKEIARIERNEIAKPHDHTMATIASVLGVRPEEISTY